tara:strand:- start:158 stop:307 length:150 start_codon:yes stop_codon:yes gene_type:complete
MIDWVSILLFTILAPSSVVLLFIMIDRFTKKQWPFGKRKRKVNSGAKFG